MLEAFVNLAEHVQQRRGSGTDAESFDIENHLLRLAPFLPHVPPPDPAADLRGDGISQMIFPPQNDELGETQLAEEGDVLLERKADRAFAQMLSSKVLRLKSVERRAARVHAVADDA